MSKSEFIKWLLEVKGEVARAIVENGNYFLYSEAVEQSLYDQNRLLADIINAAEDINSLK